MGITYPLLIPEDIAQLHATEKAARDKIRADRIRMLRFLKEERVAGVSQAAEILGYSVRTVQRWWQSYCAGGRAVQFWPMNAGIAQSESWRGMRHRRKSLPMRGNM